MTFAADDSRVDDVTTETDVGVGRVDVDNDERCCCCCVFTADRDDREPERRIPTVMTTNNDDDGNGVTETDVLSMPKLRIPRFLHELSKKGAHHSQVPIL